MPVIQQHTKVLRPSEHPVVLKHGRRSADGQVRLPDKNGSHLNWPIQIPA